MADIFQEVEEELRRDKAAQYWTRYGRYIIAAVVLIVVATGTYVGWTEYRLQQQTSYGERFAVAMSLIQEQKPGEAIDALGALAEDASTGYATLARFRAAGLKMEQGDRNGAAAIYDAIAKDGSVDSLYAQLANLYFVLGMLDTGDYVDLTDRLTPLLADDSPWRFSARELAALLELQKGDTAKANEYYTTLADDPQTPTGARARAAEMLRALKQ
ncbi:MAG: tetratricopeptide repeat protein [Pseudomonadota bacterium]